MSKKDVEYFKVITVGDSGVGKTSIIRKYVYNVFEYDNMSTIGINFTYKEVDIGNNTKINMKIIDTAGQEKYQSLAKSYFKNADGVLFVFALDNLNSFNNISEWIIKFDENNEKEGIPRYLIGNKCDIDEGSIKVSQNLINDFLKDKKYKYKETSAANGNNIDDVFKELGYDIFKDYKPKDQKALKLDKRKDKKGQKEKCVLCAPD